MGLAGVERWRRQDGERRSAPSRIEVVLDRIGRELAVEASPQLGICVERELCRLLGARAVRLGLQDPEPGGTLRPLLSGSTVTVDVPCAMPGARGVLTVEMPPGVRLDAEDAALVEVAVPLAGLVLHASWAPQQQRSARDDGAAPLIGSTPEMQRLRSRLERVALTDFTVLVEGESGTGKELVARQIHDLSRRRKGPFVAVNCAALVETLLEAELFGIEDRTATGVRGRRGKFENAGGGTLFLDEISDLSLSAQAKLLRAIQDLAVERVGGHGTRRVDVRIVAATNRPLTQVVEKGLFRSDLFYRLAGVEIVVPPLRGRQDDIPELARYFLSRHRHTRPLEFSAAAIDALRLYPWPGNVRELERLVESVVTLSESSWIELDDLPSKVRGDYAETLGPALVNGESLRAWGSRYARLVYERCGRNKRRTCRWLNISYHTLEAYLRYGQRSAGRTSSQLPEWARGDS